MIHIASGSFWYVRCIHVDAWRSLNLSIQLTRIRSPVASVSSLWLRPQFRASLSFWRNKHFRILYIKHCYPNSYPRQWLLRYQPCKRSWCMQQKVFRIRILIRINSNRRAITPTTTPVFSLSIHALLESCQEPSEKTRRSC